VGARSNRCNRSNRSNREACEGDGAKSDMGTSWVLYRCRL